MTRVAIAQISSSVHKRVNLDRALDLIGNASAEGAAIVAFPEFLMAYSPSTQSAAELAQSAEPLDGPFIAALRDASRRHAIAVLATIYESSGIPDRVYDTALWLSAGAIGAVYRKLHLYDAFGFRESDKFVPGTELTPPVQTDFGRAGMMICYDLRFPELSRLLTLMGSEALFAPSGWVAGDLKVEHWQTMIRARALENGCFVIAPNQVGNIYTGHSMAVDPLGRTILDLEEKEGVGIVELDSRLVREARDKLPLLENRRADVYALTSVEPQR